MISYWIFVHHNTVLYHLVFTSIALSSMNEMSSLRPPANTWPWDSKTDTKYGINRIRVKYTIEEADVNVSISIHRGGMQLGEEELNNVDTVTFDLAVRSFWRSLCVVIPIRALVVDLLIGIDVNALTQVSGTSYGGSDSVNALRLSALNRQQNRCRRLVTNLYYGQIWEVSKAHRKYTTEQ